MSRKNSVSRTAGFMTGLAWRIILIAGVIFLLLQGVRIAYSYGHGLFYAYAMDADDDTEQEIVVTEGESVSRLAEELEDAGLIDNRTAFIVQAKLYELELEPGSYALSRSMTVVDIIEHLNQEGTKNKELADKNLLANTAESTAAAEETAADGTEIIGGTEDENSIQQDNARAMTTDSEEKNP